MKLMRWCLIGVVFCGGLFIAVEFPTLRPIAQAMWSIHFTTETEAANNPSNIVFAPNIATMEALGVASSFYPALQVLGYITAADGGGGLFYWSSASVISTDGCVTFAASGVTTGRWVRTATSPLTSKMCGAVGNTQIVTDGAMSSGSHTLTSASDLFASSDVGKVISVQGAGSGGINLVTTISGFTNSGSVTLTAANASGGNITGKTVNWGTNDTTAVQLWATYLGTNGGLAYLSPGRYTTTSEIDATIVSGTKLTIEGAGGMDTSAGPDIGSSEIVNMTAAASGAAFKIIGSANTTNVDIDFIKISSNGNALYGLETYDATSIHGHRDVVVGFGEAELYLTGSGTSVSGGISDRWIEDTFANGAGDGVLMDNPDNNDITFENDLIIGNVGFGIHQKGVAIETLEVRIANSQFLNNTGTDINFEGDVQGGSFPGNYYELDPGNTQRPVMRFQNGSNAITSGISIAGTEIIDGTTTPTSLITFGTAAAVNISGTAISTGQSITNFVGPDPTITGGQPTISGAGSSSVIEAPALPGSGGGAIANTYNDNLGGLTLWPIKASIRSQPYTTQQTPSASAVSLSSTTPENIAIVSLTAGKWYVSGQVSFVAGSSTTINNLTIGADTTSATLPTSGLTSRADTGSFLAGVVSTNIQSLNFGPTLVNMASAGNVYLVAESQFAVSTLSAYGQIVAVPAQ